MLKLHFAPNSRAVRTLWLLEELGLDYELNRMDFHPKDLKSDEHRARHPLGRIPVLEDGDITIWESGAIAEYILERHKNGGLKPSPDAPNYPKYLQWFHYCEGMVMPPINTIVVHTILLPPERRDETALGQAQRLLGRAVQPRVGKTSTAQLSSPPALCRVGHQRACLYTHRGISPFPCMATTSPQRGPRVSLTGLRP